MKHAYPLTDTKAAVTLAKFLGPKRSVVSRVHSSHINHFQTKKISVGQFDKFMLPTLKSAKLNLSKYMALYVHNNI